MSNQDKALNDEAVRRAEEVADEASGRESGGNAEGLRALLDEEKERAATYLANWQRAQADFANLKRRTEQERSEAVRFANTALLTSLLPALDDLDRALATIPADLADNPWFDGLRLIQRKLHSSLEAQGVSVIAATGEDFDPNFHDAVLYQEGEEGKVLQEFQKGYKLYDRVIRPATVAVGRGLPSAE